MMGDRTTHRPFWVLTVGLLAGCGAGAGEEDLAATLYDQDTAVAGGFTPRAGFTAVTPAVAISRRSLSVEGDIIVVEGDARRVSSSGPGAFGLTEDNQRALLEDVLGLVPDRFDTFVFFTSFEDQATADRAYYVSLRNNVQGIGLQLRNDRTEFGLPAEGRLSGYVGMNSPLVWGGGRLDGLEASQGSFHAAIARFVSARWGMYLRFRMANGMDSSALLGPMDRGWSPLAQSEGSVLGGNLLERREPPDMNGVATYVNGGVNLGFAPLDLYAMGRLPRLDRTAAEQVPVLFYLSEATVGGMAVDRSASVPVGTEVRGIPLPVGLAEVIDAMGRREPSHVNEDPYYRVAFVFVTTPGSERSAWADQLQLLQRVRQDLPASWKAWGAGNLCTQIEEPCPEPQLALGRPVLEDDGDGLVAPGETLGVRLSILNTGLGTTEGVQVSLRAASSGVSVTGGPFTAPALDQNSSVTLTDAFSVTVTSSACGTAVTLAAEMITQEGPVFVGDFELPVGTNPLRFDPVEEGVDWTVDPDLTDTESAGAWALGDPEAASAAGITTQPEDDHTPDEGKLAFFTGPEFGGFVASNDLDGGRTTLESPIFAIGEAVDPIVVFYAWRSVWDFSVDPIVPQRQAPLVVQASNDGGRTYTELGRFESQTEEWARVQFRLRDAVAPTDRVRFRFVAEESMNGNVELGIDDLEIIDFLPNCAGVDPGPGPDPGPDPGPGPGDGDDNGGGCGGVRGRSGGAWAVLIVGLALLLRRRRD